MSPPSWALVEAKLRDWTDQVLSSERGLREPGEEPLAEGLACLHSHFEQVHPFIDGNGRVGRLILNLILVRLGYPRTMYDNLDRFIVPNPAGPAKLVPLTALVDADFSLVALRQAAQRGRLDALQGADGVWRSSRKASSRTKRTRDGE